MRILFVLGGLRIGGYEILTVKTANALSQRGNKVAIVSLSKDQQILERVSPEVELHFAIRYFKFDLSIMLRVFKILRNFKPDIVISCAFFEYFIAKFASFYNFGKPKFILAFHFTKPFDQKEKQWNKIYTFLAKLFKDNYITIHKSQIEFFNKHYGLPRKRFKLIHNGVDIEYFRPERIKNKQCDGIFRIVHIANLKPLKDQWTLLKAMIELDKTYKKWELKIAGEDQVNLRADYEEFVKQCNLMDRIKFLGPVKETREVLSNADVFILTSITESLPVSVIEAIAMGVPCIVTDVGGNPDIIENGKEGFLVEPGDYKTIAQYLKFLIENPVKRRKMSIAAREKAIREFDFNMMIKKYCNFFNYILQK